MRTTCTHYRRSYRHVFGECLEIFLFAEELFSNDSLREFAFIAEDFFALYINAEVLAVRFDNSVKFFDYINRFKFFCKVLDKLFRQRVYNAEFEIRNSIAKCFLCVLVGNTAGNYTDFCIRVNFCSVE